jgi:Uma2 family endonuclease
MVAPAAVRFTYADYRNLPEESRYEIIDGDLQMSPSPTTAHQRIALRLADLLMRWARKTGTGEVFIAPCDVVLSETDVVQPDIFFVSKGRQSIIGEKAILGAPDLVVEVLSPATADRDRTAKAKLYARAGVAELWLVDPESRTIEILVNSPSGFARHGLANLGEIAKSATLDGLAVSADSIFGK